jgi:hypothetical protein
MLMLAVTVLVAPAVNLETPSTSICHAVIGLFEDALAEIAIGEAKVELLAGEDALTLT